MKAETTIQVKIKGKRYKIKPGDEIPKELESFVKPEKKDKPKK